MPQRFRWFFATLGLVASASLGANNASLQITAYSQGNGVIFEQVQPMSFGRFVPADGGTIRLSPNGVIAANNQILLNGNHQAGRMRIAEGKPGDWIDIELAEESIYLHPDSGTGAPILVDNFKFEGTSIGNMLGFRLFELNDQGEAEFLIGATLTVNSNQASGSYSGQLTLTLSFE